VKIERGLLSYFLERTDVPFEAALLTEADEAKQDGVKVRKI